MAEPQRPTDIAHPWSHLPRSDPDQPAPGLHDLHPDELPTGGRPPGIPARFADAHLDQLDGEIARVAAEWIDGHMAANVVLLGAVGVGKTHAAAALARHAWQQGRRIRFAPVVELMDELRPNGGRPQALDEACAVDLLVLDDIGCEKPTDWTGERLYAVINRRWLECRPTIATSNLAPERVEERIGSQAWSRLYHDAIGLRLAGDDRRRSAA